MTITVRLFATFRDFLPQHARRSGLQIELDERGTVRVLLTALGVPDEAPKIVLVNGQYAMENHVLRNGDIVSVFPPLIGGHSSRAH